MPVAIDRAVLATLPMPSVTLSRRASWSPVVVLATLAGMHLTVAVPLLTRGRWDGYVAAALAGLFAAAALVALRWRREVTISARDRALRVRTGTRRLSVVRHVPFCQVRGVRLTMTHAQPLRRARIAILCDGGEEIPCPPTVIPRQQALYLALTMNVPLVKVLGTADRGIHRIDRLLPR